MKNKEESFSELIYAGQHVEKIILTKYSNATFEDARDEVHEECFEVRIPSAVDKLEFYKFAVDNKFLGACFKFRLSAEIPYAKNIALVNEVIKYAKST
jgi:hypothetical protein